MEVLHVRKQGNICTVFLDDSSRPLPIASAEVEPQGMPYTFHRRELEQRFPGKQYVFHERLVTAPPTMADLIPHERGAEVEAELESIMRERAKDVAAPGEAPVALDIVNAVPRPILAHVEALIAAFGAQAHALLPGDEEGRRDLEAVGSFLINAFPELEPALVEAAKPRPEAGPKKRFSLGGIK